MALAYLGGAGQPAWAFPNSFDYSRVWHGFFGVGQEVQAVGDFNGDNRDDVITFIRDTKPEPARGCCWVALSDGRRFGESSQWHPHLCYGQEVPGIGDFNGDGRDDVAVFVKDAAEGRTPGNVRVSLSTGSAFGPSTRWASGFARGAVTPMVGDFNGDGRSDLICFNKSAVTGDAEGDVYVALSSGSDFGRATKWHDWFSISTEVPLVGDFNGDGRSEIATVVTQGAEKGKVYVAAPAADHFETSSVWAGNVPLPTGWEYLCAGDPNNDGKQDLVIFTRGRPDRTRGANDPAAKVYTMLSTGTSFGPPVIRHAFFAPGEEIPMVGDFDGDRSTARLHRRARNDIITFVRDTQTGGGRGDAWVALSTFGVSSTWRLRLERLHISRLNESADEPLVVLTAIRSKVGLAGSTRTIFTGMHGVIGDSLGLGTTTSIPSSMGEIVIPDVRVLDAASLAQGGKLEYLAIGVTALEHDGSSWEDHAATMGRCLGAASACWQRDVERARPGDITQASLYNGACNLNLLVHDELLQDDDDVVGRRCLAFVLVDPECAGLLPPPGWVGPIYTAPIPANRYTVEVLHPGTWTSTSYLTPQPSMTDARDGIYDFTGSFQPDPPPTGR